jgi:hypothetical protein
MILLHRHRLSPADAYLALRLSVLIGKPIDYVIVRYNKHKKRGWGYIAKKLGIKPGSDGFYLLKTGGYVVLERTRKERKHVEELRIKVVHPDNPPHGASAWKHEGHGGGGKGKSRGKR